jgi:hypothetical protein
MTPALHSDAQQKIFEVQAFCSAKYFCRQQLIAKYYTWTGDSIPQACGKCDNCVSCTKENAQTLQDAVDDVCEMMEVVRCLTAQHENITKDDVIDVFTKAKTKEMETKGYFTSKAYNRIYTRKVLRTKDLASQALSDLIASGFVKQICELKGQKKQMTCNTYILGVEENAQRSVQDRPWVYLIPCRQTQAKKK